MDKIDDKTIIKNTPGSLKRLSALEDRADTVEATIAQLVGSLNQNLEQSEARATNHAQYIQAIVEYIGEDKINEVLRKHRADAETAKELEARKWLAGQVESGALEPRLAVAEDCLLVGVRTDSDGNELQPSSHVQLWTSTLVPEIRAAVIGKPAGTVIDVPGGDQIEILDIFGLGVPKAVAPTGTPFDEASTVGPEVQPEATPTVEA